MILVDRRLISQPWKVTNSTTKLWTAVTIRLHATDILVSTVYLPPDDQLNNIKTMQELAHMVGQVQCPYIIAGDFNTPPEGMDNTTMMGW